MPFVMNWSLIPNVFRLARIQPKITVALVTVATNKLLKTPIRMTNKQSATQNIQAKITENLESAFDAVIIERNKYYQENPGKIPNLDSIDSIVKSSALANAAISGGSSLVPGPIGMLAIVPELVLVTRNQISLIYDVAAAHGQKEAITKELLAAVFVSAMGTTAGGLLVVQGSKLLVKRASLQVFQKLVVILGGKITQQALKSAISKWLPGVGAAAMAAWSNYMTRKIGNKSKELFSKQIVQNDDVADIELITPLDISAEENKNEDRSSEYEKIQILINLAKIDGQVDESESEFIGNLIDKADITHGEKIDLISSLGNLERQHFDTKSLERSPDEAIALLVNLTLLAKLDGRFHITEKLYIKQIGKMLNFSAADIEEVMAS